jgi:hypothetical protein
VLLAVGSVIPAGLLWGLVRVAVTLPVPHWLCALASPVARSQVASQGPPYSEYLTEHLTAQVPASAQDSAQAVAVDSAQAVLPAVASLVLD